MREPRSTRGVDNGYRKLLTLTGVAADVMWPAQQTKQTDEETAYDVGVGRRCSREQHILRWHSRKLRSAR